MPELIFPNRLHRALEANAEVGGQVDDLRDRVRAIEPKVSDATGNLKQAEDRLGKVEPIATAAHNKVKDAVGTLKGAEGRLDTIEPIANAAHDNVRDAAGTLKDAEVRLDKIEPKVTGASEEVTLGSLESDRNRLIAYGLLRDLIDQWGQTLCAPVQEMKTERAKLLEKAQPFEDAFNEFALSHEIAVPSGIAGGIERLSDAGVWGNLQDVFDTLSDLRKRAGEFLTGTTPAEPEATGVAGRNPTRSRSKRTT